MEIGFTQSKEHREKMLEGMKGYRERKHDGKDRFRFFCERCQKYFETLLGLEDAICVNCGSSKIME